MLGMWMWPTSIEKYGTKKVVSRCVGSGVTDLYFLVKGLAGKTAYSGKFAPVVCERDLLRELLDETHKHGIRVHAWFTSASDNYYKEIHPESGRYHFSRGRDRGLISLADEGYLCYMENIIGEMCRCYDVDGLHLDYIRYNHVLYGWSEEDMTRYAAEGADVAHLKPMMERLLLKQPDDEKRLMDAYHSGDQSVLALARARRKDVTAFARRMIDAALAEKSQLILSAALMPEGAYDDTAFADLHYGQNYEDIVQLVEFGLPMAYSKAYGQDGQWVRKVAQGSLNRGLKTIMGLHAFEGGTGPALQQDIAALKDLPLEGICLFREGATALAHICGEKAAVCNTTDVDFSKVIILDDHGIAVHEKTIPAGEELIFPISGAVRQMQVFAGETEYSVYVSLVETQSVL